MFLNRGVDVEKFGLVRRPKPCTASLQVGDRVYLNGLSSRYSVPILSISGETVTVESQDWKGNPEAVTFPRICLRKARIRSWLYRFGSG
jgi:hypothetical protein